MAHFYGTLQGARGQATRCGTPGSGMETVCASWAGAVRCSAYVREEDGEDCVRVALQPWQGRGISKLLYDGPLSGLEGHALHRWKAVQVEDCEECREEVQS